MQIQNRMPDLHKMVGAKISFDVDKKVNIFCKTHFVYSNDHPYIEHTAGVVYILRNPRDVLLSALRFHRLFTKKEINEIKMAFQEKVISDYTDIKYNNFKLRNSSQEMRDRVFILGV